MLDLQVLDELDVAVAALEPLRARVLAALVTPGSASSLSPVLGEPRQKINYHLRTLEDHGLVTLVEERPRRGLTERIVQASARGYVISPGVLGELAADPARVDRLSTAYLLASASRLIDEVSAHARAADAEQRRLATLTIDAEIRFASATARAAFTEELAAAVTELAGRYHDEATEGGRWHRLLVAAHPSAPPTATANPTTTLTTHQTTANPTTTRTTTEDQP